VDGYVDENVDGYVDENVDGDVDENVDIRPFGVKVWIVRG
jgi:hypothetical protein